jgi:hypothetical protein
VLRCRLPGCPYRPGHRLGLVARRLFVWRGLVYGEVAEKSKAKRPNPGGSGRPFPHHSQHRARSIGGQASSNHGCFTGRGQKRIMSVRGQDKTKAGRPLNQSRLHGPSGRDVTPGTISLGWRNSQWKVMATTSKQIARTAQINLLIWLPRKLFSTHYTVTGRPAMGSFSLYKIYAPDSFHKFFVAGHRVRDAKKRAWLREILYSVRWIKSSNEV